MTSEGKWASTFSVSEEVSRQSTVTYHWRAVGYREGGAGFLVT